MVVISSVKRLPCHIATRDLIGHPFAKNQPEVVFCILSTSDGCDLQDGFWWGELTYLITAGGKSFYFLSLILGISASFILEIFQIVPFYFTFFSLGLH